MVVAAALQRVVVGRQQDLAVLEVVLLTLEQVAQAHQGKGIQVVQVIMQVLIRVAVVVEQVLLVATDLAHPQAQVGLVHPMEFLALLLHTQAGAVGQHLLAVVELAVLVAVVLGAVAELRYQVLRTLAAAAAVLVLGQ